MTARLFSTGANAIAAAPVPVATPAPVAVALVMPAPDDSAASAPTLADTRAPMRATPAPASAAMPTPAQLPPRRRGACPSLARPMQTGDGFLARIRLATPGLAPEGWLALAGIAQGLGNGLLEVTARGSLQLRGLGPQAAPGLAQALAAAGIDIATGLAMEVPPLAGLDGSELADARPLAAKIAHAAQSHLPPLQLAPKLSVIVNGGGRFGLSGLAADLRLDAVREGGVPVWRLAASGDAASARPLGTFAEDEAAGAVLHLLETLSQMGPTARGRDLPAGSAPARREASAPSPIGLHRDGAMIVLGLGLRFGRTQAGDLVRLATGLARLGAQDIRPAPGHALLVTGLTAEAAGQAARLAAGCGFITDPADPALSVLACPGAGLCASARLDTRALAKAAIASAPALFDGSCPVHLSGCAKGCAHPGPAALALVGGEGRAGIVLDGKAGEAPVATLAAAALPAALAALQARITAAQQPGETARQVLARLGPRAIAEIFKGSQ